MPKTLEVMSLRNSLTDDPEELGTITLNDDGTIVVEGESAQKMVDAVVLRGADGNVVTPDDGEAFFEAALDGYDQGPYLFCQPRDGVASPPPPPTLEKKPPQAAPQQQQQPVQQTPQPAPEMKPPVKKK